MGLMDIINGLGYALDTPGALLRGVLSGEPGHRASGRDMLESWGLLDANRPGLDAGDVAGFGADMLVDPLNLIGAGWIGKLLGKASKVEKANKEAHAALSVAKASARKLLDEGTPVFRGDMVKQAIPGAAENISHMQSMRDVMGLPEDWALKRWQMGVDRSIESARANVQRLHQATPMAKYGVSRELDNSYYNIMDYARRALNERRRLRTLAERKQIAKDLNFMTYVSPQRETAEAYAKQIDDLPEFLFPRPPGYSPTVTEMRMKPNGVLDLRDIGKSGMIDEEGYAEAMRRLGVPEERVPPFESQPMLDAVSAEELPIYSLFRNENATETIPSVMGEGYSSIRFAEGPQDNIISLYRSDLQPVDALQQTLRQAQVTQPVPRVSPYAKGVLGAYNAAVTPQRIIAQ